MEYLLTHPYFAVREVKVLGAEKLKGADIVVMSGLGPNTRIWSIDPAVLEERVRQHPWVKRVVVRRELPARLVITIEEWKAGGIVALDQLYYVADNGVIFKAVDEGDSVDYPFITGLRAAALGAAGPGGRGRSWPRPCPSAGRWKRPLWACPRSASAPAGASCSIPYPTRCRSTSVGVTGTRSWTAFSGSSGSSRGRGARFKAVDVSFKGQVVARPRGARVIRRTLRRRETENP